MKIRYKNHLGTIKETNVPKPAELRDGSQDCLNDYISDCLAAQGIKYKWFRIIK